MRPYNSLRALEDRFVYATGTIFPPRKNHGQSVSGRYWKTRKGALREAVSRPSERISALELSAAHAFQAARPVRVRRSMSQ